MNTPRSLFRTAFVVLAGAAALAAQNDRGGADQKSVDRTATAFDLLRERDYARALELFKRDNASYPRIAALIDGQAWCEYFLGRLDKAEEGFRKALEADPAYKWSKEGLVAVEAARRAPLDAAAAALKAGRYAEARVLYERIAEGKTAAPAAASADGWVGAGWALHYLGRYEEATKAFNQALQKRPNFADAYRGIAFGQYARKRYAEAATPFAMALKLDPGDAAARNAAAWCRYFKRDYAEAEKEFLKASETPAQAAAAWQGVGWCREMRKQDAEALDAFRRMAERGPAFFDAEIRALAAARPGWRDLFRVAAWAEVRHSLDAWAAADFRYLLAGAPDDRDLALGLAYASFRLGEYSGAIAVCDGALKDAPETAAKVVVATADGGRAETTIDAAAVRAWCRLRLGAHVEAAEAFRAIVERSGDRADARTGYAWALMAAGGMTAAEEQFKAALKLLPGHADATQGLAAVDAWRREAYFAAWRACDAGLYADAEAAFAAMKEAQDGRFPVEDLPLVDASIGWARHLRGDRAGAEAAWKSALAARANCGLALKGIGVARLAAADYASAREKLQAAAADPAFAKDADVWTALGVAENGTKQFDEAEEAFRRALAVQPDRAAALYGYGWTEKGRGRSVEARLLFERAIAVDAKTADTPELRDAIKQDREFYKLYAPLGWAGLRAGNPAKAEADFREALRLDPREPDAPRGLALARLRLGDFKESADLFGKLLAKAPAKENPWGVWSATLSEWGWTLYFAGRYGEADAAFLRLAALHAGEPIQYADPFDGLGWCALRRKQYDRARENFLKAVGVAPRYESSLKGLEALQQEAP